jgi:hypothetical protein
MTISIRNLVGLKADRAITVQNQMRRDMLRLRAGLVFHADASAAISTANATTEATLVALANAEKASYNAHIASAAGATTGQGAHMAADVTNPTAVVNATNEASAITLINDIKAKYNAHRALTTAHPLADGTNVISSADATDTASAYTLANEIKTDLNAHYAAAFGAEATLLVLP